MDSAGSRTGARSRVGQLPGDAERPRETFEGNEEVLGIDDSDFRKIKPEAAAAKITQSIGRIPAGTFIRVKVRRGADRDVILYFASATGTGAIIARPGFVKISNEFVLEIQKQVL